MILFSLMFQLYPRAKMAININKKQGVQSEDGSKGNPSLYYSRPSTFHLRVWWDLMNYYLYDLTLLLLVLICTWIVFHYFLPSLLHISLTFYYILVSFPQEHWTNPRSRFPEVITLVVLEDDSLLNVSITPWGKIAIKANKKEGVQSEDGSKGHPS